MNEPHTFSRLPFNSGDGTTRFCVAGDITTDASLDFQVPVESATDLTKLPACADCSGELYWAEPTYGLGARRCVQCGSVFLVK